MAATAQLLWAQKLKNLKSEIIQILQSHSPRYGDVQVIVQFFVGAKTQKLKVRNYSNFTITFPTIWRCAGDCLKVLPKFKMAAMDKLHIFLWAQKFKN